MVPSSHYNSSFSSCQHQHELEQHAGNLPFLQKIPKEKEPQSKNQTLSLIQ
jgi:hypothetical protein